MGICSLTVRWALFWVRGAAQSATGLETLSEPRSTKSGTRTWDSVNRKRRDALPSLANSSQASVWDCGSLDGPGCRHTGLAGEPKACFTVGTELVAEPRGCGQRRVRQGQGGQKYQEREAV
ncbi:hypothetical protein BCR39DRAFT_531117 [Naematelia encephala]|uniref:Secreted protein n=1 Tax=Naematelia encephala TaxID=71784 RepID=A0A1Y2B5P7_9TREE|nr:hypothetical protein BCR39DRAFT_531117 [Naematelia encephala]